MREIFTRGNVSLYYWGDEERGRIAIMPSNYGNQGMSKSGSTATRGSISASTRRARPLSSRSI